jgi:hypothetical protein
MKPRFTAIAVGLFFIGLIGLLTPAFGRAHLVTFDFTGTFAASDPHSLGGILTGPTGPFPASTIVGSFTFDADTLDTNVSPTVGQYNGAVTNVSLSVTNIFGAPYQFGFNSGGPLNAIQVNANSVALNQSFIMSASVQNTVPAGAIVDGANYFAREFYINLVKPSATVFASDVLPETPPSLSPFSLYSNLTNQNGQFRLVFDGHGDPHTIIGNLTSLTLSAVPIPAAVYLFGSGIICVIAMARRRMKQAS